MGGRPARTDYVGLQQELGVDLEVKLGIYESEKILTQEPSGQFVFVYDLGVDLEKGEQKIFDELGYGRGAYGKAIMNFFREYGPVGDVCYPEITGTVIILRTPFTFWAVWHLVKFFVPKETREKSEFYRDEAMSRLLELMPLSSIPKYAGGTSEVELPKQGPVVFKRAA